MTLGQRKAEAKYAEKRLSTSRDDRTSADKLDADAKLRGKIGTHAANKLIKTLDDFKSYR